MDIEEDLILARIKKRDKEAFRYLYEYYFAKMVLFAESYLYDEEEARDLVQDLFFHLWKHAGALQVATSVKAYLFTSVRNRCLNVIRDRKIRDEHNNKLFEAQLFSGTEDVIIDEDVHRRLQEARHQRQSRPEHLRGCLCRQRMGHGRHAVGGCLRAAVRQHPEPAAADGQRNARPGSSHPPAVCDEDRQVMAIGASK